MNPHKFSKTLSYVCYVEEKFFSDSVQLEMKQITENEVLVSDEEFHKFSSIANFVTNQTLNAELSK